MTSSNLGHSTSEPDQVPFEVAVQACLSVMQNGPWVREIEPRDRDGRPT
jgi:hypothetical protein